MGVTATQIKQGVVCSWLHRTKSFCSRSSKEIQQHGLGLVVHGVASGGTVREHRAAGVASTRFEIWTLPNVDNMADKMNTKKICQLFHEHCVFAARRSKSMIHVVQRHTSIRCSSQDRERR
jgi:hypothetical protein